LPDSVMQIVFLETRRSVWMVLQVEGTAP